MDRKTVCNSEISETLTKYDDSTSSYQPGKLSKTKQKHKKSRKKLKKSGLKNGIKNAKNGTKNNEDRFLKSVTKYRKYGPKKSLKRTPLIRIYPKFPLFILDKDT